MTDKAGNIIVENIKADSKGEIVTPTLPAGEYTLNQINQVIGYKQITEKVVANGTTGNHANTTGSSLLPQTGEQVALYSLVGMLLIGAAFMLFKRNRRKA